jgi:LuxR family transcriptional regulator of csgAB operon
VLRLENIKALFLISKDCLNTGLLTQHLRDVFCHSLRIEQATRVPDSCHSAVGIIINADSYDNDELRQIIRSCYKRFPKVALIILNACDSSTPLEIAEWPNVKAVFYNTAGVDTIETGFKAIDMGYLWIPRQFSEHLINTLRTSKAEDANQVKLTQREKEIIKLLSEGKSNEDIADDLFISPHTVKTHLYKVYKKLNVKNRFEAFTWVAKNLA